MPAPESAAVHPLVLLSIVDHYNRSARDTKRRVVGALLGEVYKGVVQVTNSFALPFEEDAQNPQIWFVDHSYMENMFAMFRKVNAREKMVGWYSTGPRLREADLDINAMLSNYTETPVLVICEVNPKQDGLPTTAYYAKDEIREDGTQKSQKVFVNIPTEVGATEAEEVGVEHLLRDVKDATISTLSTEVERMSGGLKTLRFRLIEIQQYLELVLKGRLPVNHDIIYSLQDIFNLLPNIDAELNRSFAVKSNDMMLVVYVASLIRSVLALHNLINNKEQRMWREKEAIKAADAKKKDKEKEKEKEKAKHEENGKKDAEAEEANGITDSKAKEK